MCMVAYGASAQQLVDYEYAKYGLGFKAPVGFNIKTNTDKSFAIDNGKNVTFQVNPYRNANVDKALDVARVAYQNLGCANKQVAEESEVEMEGFEGYYFVGSGDYNGREVIFIAVGALDRDSDVNFYCIGQFWADAQAESNTDLVLNLIASFHKQ